MPTPQSHAAATSSYVYNGGGMRTSKTTGGVTTQFTWSVRRSLPVILDDGSNQYTYGLGLIGMIAPGGVISYFLPDGLGSTANVTDVNGNVTATYCYDVFGSTTMRPSCNSGSSTDPFLFTGEQRDAESGYSYLRARYYDPATGRFVSRDPLGGGYKYAGNNPVNATDPSGMAQWITEGPDGPLDYAQSWTLWQAQNGALAGDSQGVATALASIGWGQFGLLAADLANNTSVVSGRWLYIQIAPGLVLAADPPMDRPPPDEACISPEEGCGPENLPPGQRGLQSNIKVPADPNRLHHIFDNPTHRSSTTGLSQEQNVKLIEEVVKYPGNISGSRALGDGNLLYLYDAPIGGGFTVHIEVYNNTTVSDAWILP